MDNKTRSAYQDFVSEIELRFDEIREKYSLGDTATDDKVFCYLIAEQFADLEDNMDCFVYSDGHDDLGVDFYILNEDTLTVFQCKSVLPETLAKDKIPSFGTNPFNEINEGVRYLLGADQKANKFIKDLRVRYRRMKELNPELRVHAGLAVLGSYTDAGNRERANLKRSMGEDGVAFRAIDWNEIKRHLHQDSNEDKSENIVLKLCVEDPQKDILRQRDWLSAVVTVSGLIEGYSKYETDLFDLNVRAYNGSSKINKDIARSVETPRGRKNFVHYNNGLLITCSSYHVSDEKQRPGIITVKGAQIVNGCQTVSSINHAYDEMTNDEDQDAVKKDTKIIVKILQKPSDEEVLKDIIAATNNQNPMSPRNLFANTREQRQLQIEFRTTLSNCSYYYVRKDNELGVAAARNGASSLLSAYKIANVKGRKGVHKYRHIDNTDLAQIWLAWIGNSFEAKAHSGSYIFEEKERYNRVFLRRPDNRFWDAIKEKGFLFKNYTGFFSELSEKITPHVFQYTLAVATEKWLSQTIESKKETRAAALERIRSAGKLKSGSSSEDEAKALVDDRDYKMNVWKSQMHPGYIELASFVLANVYGDLGPDTCKKLLLFKDYATWLMAGMDKKNIEDESLYQNKDSLLCVLYNFLDEAVTFYITTHKSALVSAAGKANLMLHEPDAMASMKDRLLEYNEVSKEYPTSWKSPGCTVFESFPKLT